VAHGWAARGYAMLVITRREGEEVVVGDPRNPIGVVRIASIKGDRIRLAFDFPRTIDVHRREVADQIVSEGDPADEDDATHAPPTSSQAAPKASPENGHARAQARRQADAPEIGVPLNKAATTA